MKQFWCVLGLFADVAFAGTALAFFGLPGTPVLRAPTPTPTPTPTIIPALATCTSKLNTCLAAASMRPRFIDNGDGTVTDTTTALMWEKKTTDGSVHDVGNTYTWSTGTGDYNFDGTAKTDFLDKLNDTAGGGQHCFAGYCDWRLPNEEGQNTPGAPEELETILDYTQGNCGGGTGPCVFPALGPTQLIQSRPDYYWSATTIAGYPPTAFGVGFDFGAVTFFTKPFSLYVRAVRSGL
jgi:predicted heme/steroid binding protein